MRVLAKSFLLVNVLISTPGLAATTLPVSSVTGFVDPQSPTTSLSVVEGAPGNGTFAPAATGGSNRLKITTTTTSNGPFSTAPDGTGAGPVQTFAIGNPAAPYASQGLWSYATRPPTPLSQTYGGFVAGKPAANMPVSGTRDYQGAAFAHQFTRTVAGTYLSPQRLTSGATAATVNFATRKLSVSIVLPGPLGGLLVLTGKKTLAGNKGTMQVSGNAPGPSGSTVVFRGQSTVNARFGLFGPAASSLGGTFYVQSNRANQNNYLVSGTFGGTRR